MAVAVFHYPGGKANLAPWIADRLPLPGSYGVFVDVFGGAASILLEIMRRNEQAGKRPHYVYNDKDEEIVNFFRVLRNREMRDELREMLHWTPYSRKQFCDCIEIPVTDEPIHRAWRFFVLQQQIIGGGIRAYPGRWSYDAKKKGGALKRWLNSQERLMQFGEMFRQVQVECLDFTEVFRRYDGRDVLFYVDPPYFPDTRYSNDIYSLELPREKHEELASLLHDFPGMAAISGYRCPEYDSWYASWERYDQEVPCHMSASGSTGNLKGLKKPRRIESIWLNSAAITAKFEIRQKVLF